MADIIDRGYKLAFDNDKRAYNHATDNEYKRLREKASQLYSKRNELSQQSQQAYNSGNKQKAHELSDKSKRVLEEAEVYNRRASEYVFRENNTDSAGDEIDLHGLYVKEVDYFLRNRIASDIQKNQSHLKVIVGKGLHSAHHIAKLKPAVNQICDECRLSHRVDPKNAGVIIIDLANTHEGQIPSTWNYPQAHVGGQQYQPQQAPTYQQTYAQQQPQYQQHANNNINNDISRMLLKLFCICIKNFK